MRLTSANPKSYDLILMKERFLVYRSHERKLIWLCFIVVFIMGLSLIGRIFSG